MPAFSFSSTPLEPERYRAALADRSAGGYASFEGWVRDHNEGRTVQRLEYEAFESLAVKEGERIVAEAVERFGVARAACVHRVGSLEIGELAVWVGVSSGHRGEAFDACRYIIDEVKHRVPIWKKEHYTDGDSGWVNCERCAAAAHDHRHDHEHAHGASHGHSHGDAAKAAAAPLELQFATLADALSAGLELVDIRETWERRLDPPGLGIPHHLPLSELVNGQLAFPAEGRCLVVCAHGVRSLTLVQHLRSLGRDEVYSLRGGLAALGA